MDAKRFKYTTISDDNVEEELNTVIVEEGDIEDSEEDGQYGYEYNDEDGTIVTYDPNNEFISNGDEVIIDENGQAMTLKDLVANSTVEEVETIETNDGTHTILQIVQEVASDDYSEEHIEYTGETNVEYGSPPPKTFHCPHCGNGYSAAGSLKLHVRACTRQRREADPADRTCTVCFKVFTSANYLKEHMFRHTGDQPYRCTRCYRKFVDKNKFDAHVESHINQDRLEAEAEELAKETGTNKKMVLKEFLCSFCNEAFTVAFEAGQVKRRYACDACREKYSNPEALKEFKKKANEKREYRCDKCQRKFVFEGFLQRHKPSCDGSIKRRRDIK